MDAEAARAVTDGQTDTPTHRTTKGACAPRINDGYKQSKCEMPILSSELNVAV